MLQIELTVISGQKTFALNDKKCVVLEQSDRADKWTFA